MVDNMKKITSILIIIAATAVLYANQILIEQIAKYDDETLSFSMDTVYEVKSGESLIIPAGTELYFAHTAGIDVKGELMITGTYDRLVILAAPKLVSEYDGPVREWRGIHLFPGSTANIRNAVISHASFGIKSCCDNVSLSNTVFYANDTHFQLGDRKIHVKDHEPVYYEKSADTQPVQLSPTAPVAPQPKVGIPARAYLTGAISAACLIIGPIYISKWVKGVEEYNSYRPGNKDYDNATESQREENFYKMAKDATASQWLGIGLTTLGLVGGTYTVVYTIKF